jgi:dihydrodipicolinate synthase/N-acetylneuraminate lyase
MASTLSPEILQLLLKGTVIPAHPLALNRNRQLDETCQRAITRYYMAAGCGGIAVGVHTTQFEIRLPMFGLYESVLSLAAEEIDRAGRTNPFIRVAGIAGPTKQAVEEAKTAAALGYHFGLLSNGGLPELTEAQLIHRATMVADVIPVFGFYLQPAVGGRALSFSFWKDLAAHPNVHAIKIAAFNRYQTLDVVRAVCESGRANEIALYTGNDDNIVADLLTPYRFFHRGEVVEKRFVGGLLGHWAFWSQAAVELLERIRKADPDDVSRLLEFGTRITDVNAAVFDAANGFQGCISGINEVLRRQGLMQTNFCLLESETLSPGQMQEIDRVYAAYPDLNDDEFVTSHLKDWMSL